MSTRQTRWLLRSLIALLWGGAGAAGALAYLGSETDRDQLVVATPRATPAVEDVPVETLQFASLWDARLRRPLVDPPPPPPPPVVKPKPVVVKPPPKAKPIPKPQPPPPKPDVELVGTIIESGRPLAIVVDAEGTIDMKAPGQAFDLMPEGVTLKSVEAKSAIVVYRDRDTTLRLPDKPKPAGGSDRKPKKRTRVDRTPTQAVSPSDAMRLRQQMRPKSNE